MVIHSVNGQGRRSLVDTKGRLQGLGTDRMSYKQTGTVFTLGRQRDGKEEFSRGPSALTTTIPFFLSFS